MIVYGENNSLQLFFRKNYLVVINQKGEFENMKNMKNIKKVRVVLKVLLMFCWHVGKSTIPVSTMQNPNGSGHQLLNKALYNLLGTNAKSKLAPYKEIIFNSADPELSRKNPDERDGPLIEAGEERSHSDIDYCESKANYHTNQAVNYYNAKDYRRAAYELAVGFHYVQDMACPVHMAKLGGTNTNSYCKEYSNSQKKCKDENGNMVLCTSGQLHAAYERPLTSNVFCNSYSVCEDYQAVIDAYNDPTAGMSKKLTELVGSMSGFNVLKNNGVKEYLTHRAKLWIQYYCTNEDAKAKKRLIYDYAMAVGIQKRYLYRSGLEIFRQ